jgi:hypothetical protein
MQFSINKTKFISITATILLMTSVLSSIIIIHAQSTEQQVTGPIPTGVTPSEIIEVDAYLSFRPNPIGLNQIFLVNIWVTPPINEERYHQDYIVTITKPSGHQEVVTIDSYQADATAWFEWIADETGDWTLQFDFQGTYFPAGTYLDGEIVPDGTPGGNLLASAYYAPASTGPQTLTVQEDVVYSWPYSGTPQDYWTRPVPMENRDWWPILGNFPAWGIVGEQNWPADTSKYIANYDFIPYTEAPESSHVVWKRLGGIAGIIGGSVGQYGKLDSPGSPSVIYAGRCYQTYDKPGVGSVAGCYDLRTGEIYYEIPIAEGGVTPNVISYARGENVAVPGATETNTYDATLMELGRSTLKKIDPWTGEITLDVEGMSPTSIGGGFDSGLGAFHNDPYVLSSQNLGSLFAPDYYLINWTTAGNTEDFSERIVSNVSVGWSLPVWPGGVLGYTGNVYDFEANVNVWMVGIATEATGHYYGTWMKGFDLTTGQMLWNITFPETRYSTSCLVADHGKVALVVENGYLMCFDSRTGQHVWTSSPRMEYPWAQPSFGAYAIQSAYGMIFWETYAGVYAFNWDDGTIEWQYKAPSVPFETPYGGYMSFNSGGWVADGKLYTVNSEHTTTWPYPRGWKIHCIDAFTGEGVWALTGSGTPAAIADGYLVVSSSADGYLYVIGKGKTETTVTAPEIAVPAGTTMAIKGTVLDMSPAQPETPCVSKDSMSTQMEYLHLQQPIGGLWGDTVITGIPVTLTAIGSDGTCVDIGTTVTDGYYGTFTYAWTPETEGTYEIVASFAGDDSYGSSAAATGVVVGPALSASGVIEPEPLISTELAIALAVVAVAVVVVIGFWVLKKRK